MKVASIMFSRNDGFKDDKRCITHFLSCLETFDEIIYIDWNSDENKGSLLWRLEPYIPKTGKIKHFIITPQIAKILTPHPDSFQVNETITRNIGIRRAESDWIVSTNIDIIPPSRELLTSFIEKANKDTFYTISRRDALLSVCDKYELNQWKELYNELSTTVPSRHFHAMVTPNDHYSLINCCGDFQLAHRDLWFDIKGFEEQMFRFCFIDTNVQKKAVLKGYNLEVAYEPPLFHIEHGAYSIGKDGEKKESTEYHKETNVNKYNDAWTWVEWFKESQNDESWGLANTEIEFEVW
jgi:hypothetical protein